MRQALAIGVVPAARHRACRPLRPARAFTMIEMFVVIAIIVILISILLPSFRGARESMRELRCQNNLHQLSAAFMLFASEHDGQLPGCIWDLNQPEADHRDWLMSQSTDFTTGPQGGTIFKYLAGDSTIYRCPSLDENPPRTGSFFGRFKQSNGRFDYASIAAFTGAGLGNIQGESRMLDWQDVFEPEPTPLIVEEDPIGINGFKMNGAHCDHYPMAHTHHGGGYYATITGSVIWMNEPRTKVALEGAQRWQSQAPSGTWITLGEINYHWGAWNRR